MIKVLNLMYGIPVKRLLTAATLSILLAGCGDDKEKAATGEVGEPSVDAASTSLLRFVPADTAFYFGSLEPFPARLFTDLVDAMQLGDSWPALMANDITVQAQTDGAKMLQAMYAQYVKSLAAPETLKQAFGLGDSWMSGLYTSGNVPVARVGIVDRDGLESTLTRLEKEAGVSVDTIEDNGLLYRSYRLVDGKDGTSSMDLIIAHDKDYLVITVHGTGLDESSLGSALGQSLPEVSLAGNGRLEKLVGDHGYKPFALGFLDHTALVDALTSDTPPPFMDLLEKLAGPTAEPHPDNLNKIKNDACRNEFRDIAGRWPQTVFGYPTWDTGSNPMVIDGHALVESSNTELLDQLKTLRGSFVPIPESIAARPAMVLSLGFNIDALVPFTTWLMQSMSGANYLCEPLAEMAANMGSQLGASTMMAGMAQGVKGLTVAVLDYQLQSGQTGEQPQLLALDGLVALAAGNPAALVAMAQAFLPMLKDMPIPTDGSAMPLPLPVPGATGVVPMLAVKQQFITLFTGEGSARVVQELDAGTETGGLLNFSIDHRKYFELIELGMAQSGSMAQAGDSDGDVTGIMSEEQRKIYDAMKSMDSVVEFSMDITDQGIELTSGMQLYRPQP